MNKKLTPPLSALLEEVIRKQRPDLVQLLAKVKSGTIAEDERRTLLAAISTEFCATGLGPGDEPNKRGLLLESLLDCLNPVGRRGPARAK